MPARELSAEQRKSRNAILAHIGMEPGFTPMLRSILDAAIDEAARASPADRLAVLDAGCGRKSPLVPFRGRIDRLVGGDLHEPSSPMAYLDEFVVVDLCRPAVALADSSFGLILSNFTLEHFRDPPAALANFYRWLKPGGLLVVSTVNRGHPFVAAYLALPAAVRRRLQGSIKASEADAHPLVGACNDAATIKHALATAGFERIELQTVGHLARSWLRRWPAFALGAVGDLATRWSPSRRSTIIALARKPTRRSSEAGPSALDAGARVR